MYLRQGQSFFAGKKKSEIIFNRPLRSRRKARKKQFTVQWFTVHGSRFKVQSSKLTAYNDF
jgi:hypothetical protein